jgi:RimJ/RimL family protein N-acetyltransferase
VSALRILGAPPSHFVFLAGRIGLALREDFRAIEAVDDYGRIHAMVGYDNWTTNCAEMHCVLDTPAGARRILRPAFEYLFGQQGRRIALARVCADNPRALKLDLHLGFREVHRIRDGRKDGVDLVLLEMRREECRFLQEKPCRTDK